MARIRHIEIRSWSNKNHANGVIEILRLRKACPGMYYIRTEIRSTYRIETELRMRRAMAMLAALWGENYIIFEDKSIRKALQLFGKIDDHA